MLFKDGFKEFESTQRTLAGMETINIIRKNQKQSSMTTAIRMFYCLAE